MKNLSILIIVFMLLATLTCQSQIKGGACKYTEIPGKAIIISIICVETDNNLQQIKFNFVPDSLESVRHYRFPNFKDTANILTINGSEFVTKEWIIKNRIEVDKEFRCNRTEIIEGTCTPVVFVFPEF